ncbi:hypothetical protein DFJ73DRAFT_783649 [Zopfochytrium polystomum]|nr:hypothetical protein DFJ73DRAFT_783649 [Zopfochytrium polystomum]
MPAIARKEIRIVQQSINSPGGRPASSPGLPYDPILVIKTNQNWVALYGEPAADAVIDAIATYKRRRTQARRDVDAPGIVAEVAETHPEVFVFKRSSADNLSGIPFGWAVIIYAFSTEQMGVLEFDFLVISKVKAVTVPKSAQMLALADRAALKVVPFTTTTVPTLLLQNAVPNADDDCTTGPLQSPLTHFFLLWRCLRTVHVVTEVGDQQFSTNSWRFAYSGRKNGDDLTVQDSWSKFHSDTYEDVFLSRDDMMGPIKDDTRYGRLTLGDFGDCSRTNADRECIGALYKDGQAWARCFNNYHGWTSTYFEPIGIQFVDNVCSLDVTCFVPPEPLNWDNA